MIDRTFGSHYVQSAIDIAVRARLAAAPAIGVVPNTKEAVRLYGVALQDLQAGIAEIENNSERLDNYIQLLSECNEMLEKWQIEKARVETT